MRTLHHRKAGLGLSAAAEAATGELGCSADVAAAFGPVLAASQTRRVAIVLLTTCPLMVLVWTAALFGSRLGARHALPWQWDPPAWRAALPVAAAALLIGVWTAMAAVLATGRLTRWLPDCSRFAPAAADVAGFALAAVDLILLVLLARQLARASATLDTTPVAIAAAAGTIRVTLARRAGRRCLAIRASLI